MVGLFAVVCGIAMAQASPEPMWTAGGVGGQPDSHVAFRGTFSSGGGSGAFKILGASEYLVWLDGKLVHDGPPRFTRQHPEYQTIPFSASAGKHVLSVQVRNNGVATRILSAVRPFLWCEVNEGGAAAKVEWRYQQIPGYQPRVRRISSILGWIDWCDTNAMWPDWQSISFDDTKWQTPVSVDPAIGQMVEAKTAPVRMNTLAMKPVSEGVFINDYGYERDDPAVRFFLDDLNPKGVPSQGTWRRYDLGRVRLGRPKITLDLPKGAIVEYAMSEQLRHGRVHPWLTLSGSNSCNFDHFVARGGRQEFMPFTPKGGRYLEIHIRAPGKAKFLREEFLERTFYGEPTGSFECDDPLLNKIWRTGVETVRACSEDALVDCPTRERGQWTGDVASVATDIASVAFGDLSLSRRALVQAAQDARADGLVAGVGPGDPGYLSTYAAQWVTACVHYWELTGDKSLLEELLPAARKNMEAFARRSDSAGVKDELGWAFVDWGYVRNEGPSDMALNLHYLNALRSMTRWETAVGGDAKPYQATAMLFEEMIQRWAKSIGGWTKAGYHRASLGLLLGLVSDDEKAVCIGTIKAHLLRCFPNDPNGPRLSDPGIANDTIMTPYFAHFSFAALLEAGEVDFVLGQYRKCWGWALGDGRTTWLEVFDTRWSHCHEWSGCPTWQLSRYVLGIRPRLDLGSAVYEVDVRPGGLNRASGTIPLPLGGVIRVEWKRVPEGVRLRIESLTKIKLLINGNEVTMSGVLNSLLAKKS